VSMYLWPIESQQVLSLGDVAQLPHKPKTRRLIMFRDNGAGGRSFACAAPIKQNIARLIAAHERGVVNTIHIRQ